MSKHSQKDDASDHNLDEVLRRINAVRKIQKNILLEEAAYFAKDYQESQRIHEKLSHFYQKRYEIINGICDISEYDSDDEEALPKRFAINFRKNDKKGIPRFWLNVLRNSKYTEGFTGWLVQECDKPLLKCLTDIKLEYDNFYNKDGVRRYKIIFTFGDNQYMTNKELYLTVYIQVEPSGKDIFNYSPGEPVSYEGCKIDWLPNRSLTDNLITFRSQTDGKRNKMVKCDSRSHFSFFHIFTYYEQQKLSKEEKNPWTIMGISFKRFLRICDGFREIIANAFTLYTKCEQYCFPEDYESDSTNSD